MHPIINWPPASARTVALIANGAIYNFPATASLVKSYERIIAVDGGLRHCKDMGISPDFIIGDFDSAEPELLAQYCHVPSKRFPVDKDETDLELAVEAVNSAGAEKIGIFGALDRRLDHALYNLYLMSRFPHKVIIETELETIFIITGEQIIPCSHGQRLSLLPFGSKAQRVTTQGLKWELYNAVLDKSFASVSNTCLSTSVSVSVPEGELICCLARH